MKVDLRKMKNIRSFLLLMERWLSKEGNNWANN